MCRPKPGSYYLMMVTVYYGVMVYHLQCEQSEHDKLKKKRKKREKIGPLVVNIVDVAL